MTYASEATESLERLSRIESFEREVYGDLVSHLASRHIAASRTADVDLSPASPEQMSLALDSDVLTTVRWAASNGKEHQAVIPLADLESLLDAGVTLIDVAAPPPGAPAWIALASTPNLTALVLDYRGMGKLATSRSPGPGGLTFGAWLQTWSERSGVSEVNTRRENAMRELFQQYGNKHPDFPATRIAAGIRTLEIIEFANAHSEFGWLVQVKDGPTLRSPSPPTPTTTVADRIADALSVEAFGAKRPELPSAQKWRIGYELGDRPLDDDGAPAHQGTMVYGEPVLAPQVTGDWTTSQRSSDPTGDVVAAAMDDTLPLGVAIAHGIATLGFLQHWRDCGLTDRQIQVRFLDQLGLKDREIATTLKIARSTVANTLKAGRKKIRDFSATA